MIDMEFRFYSTDYIQLKKFFYKYYIPIYKSIITYSSPHLTRKRIRFNAISKNKKTLLLFKLFYINRPIKLQSLCENFLESEIDLLSKCKIISIRKSRVFPNFFILPSKEIIFSDRLQVRGKKNFVYTNIESIWFLQFINTFNLENDFILDVGTGPGTLAIGIRKCKWVIGCDINERAISFSRINQNFHKKKSISFINKNYLNLISRYKFDTIISNTPYIPNDPHIKTKELYKDGGKTGFEFTRRLIKKFLSSSAKRLFLITLPPVSNNKLLIVEFLNKLENVGYEIRVITKVLPYSVLLRTSNKKQVLKTLIRKNIDYFYYCFVKIEKNSNKKLLEFQYKDFWIKDIINNLKNEIFLHLPNSIILPIMRIYDNVKKIFVQI